VRANGRFIAKRNRSAWEVSGKNTTVIFLDKLTQRMTQGYLTNPATRQIYVCKQYTPFPWADAHFESGFELPAPSSSLNHY
jgi:hypothetical protein